MYRVSGTHVERHGLPLRFALLYKRMLMIMRLIDAPLLACQLAAYIYYLRVVVFEKIIPRRETVSDKCIRKPHWFTDLLE